MSEKTGKANVFYEAAKALAQTSGRQVTEILKEMEEENKAGITTEGKMKIGDYIRTDRQIHEAQLHEQENKPED